MGKRLGLQITQLLKSFHDVLDSYFCDLRFTHFMLFSVSKYFRLGGTIRHSFYSCVTNYVNLSPYCIIKLLSLSVFPLEQS